MEDDIEKYLLMDVAYQAKKLNHLVEWDRFTLEKEVDSKYYCQIYGWIKREDTHLDFVLLNFMWDQEASKYDFSWCTSSSEYSKEINKILSPDDSLHNECRSAKVIEGLNLVEWQKGKNIKKKEDEYTVPLFIGMIAAFGGIAWFNPLTHLGILFISHFFGIS